MGIIIRSSYFRKQIISYEVKIRKAWRERIESEREHSDVKPLQKPKRRENDVSCSTATSGLSSASAMTQTRELKIWYKQSNHAVKERNWINENGWRKHNNSSITGIINRSRNKINAQWRHEVTPVASSTSASCNQWGISRNYANEARDKNAESNLKEFK